MELFRFLEVGLNEKTVMAVTNGSNSFRYLLFLGFNAWISELAARTCTILQSVNVPC